MASFEELTHIITDDSHPIVTRRAAVIALGKIGSSDIFPFLLEALCDDASTVRREAANALQKCNFSEATPALIDALKKEGSDLTRWTFIETLGNIGTESALPELEDLLSVDVSLLTRREVRKSIDQITDRYSDENITETSSVIREPLSVVTDTPEILDSSTKQIDQTEDSEEFVDQNKGCPDEMSSNADDILIDDKPESVTVVDKEAIEENDGQTVIDLEIDTRSIDLTSDVSRDVEETTSIPSPEADADTDSPQHSAPNGTPLKRHEFSPPVPVLVPNTSVVLYEEEDHGQPQNVLAMVLRPDAYLSKQWISRTRLYFLLLCLLLAATIGLVYSQVQRLPRPPYLPSEKIAFVENPQHYFNAGNFFIQEGDYRSAIEMYELIRGIDMIDPVLYKNLGLAHYHENQYAHSVEAYEFYLKSRKKKVYQPFVAEASISFIEDTDGEGSISDYKMYNILGTAYRQLGNFDKARLAYEAAMKIAPSEAETYNNLAKLYTNGYQQKHRLTEALAHAAVRLNPDIASYHDTLGWVLSKSGRRNKATAALQQAIRLQSDYVPAYYHLSEINQQTKDTEKSVKVVRNTLIKNMRRNSKWNSGILGVLSHIYETESQKIERFCSSFLILHSVKR